VVVDYSMSAAEIEKAAEAAGVEVAQPHPLGMYISVAKYRITLPSDIQKLTDGSICVVPTALQVVFSYVHRTIYIAREIRGDPCLSGAWVAREMASARATPVMSRSLWRGRDGGLATECRMSGGATAMRDRREPYADWQQRFPSPPATPCR
jgi:hypothetical protein